MTELMFYNGLLITWLAIAAITFIALFFITAPYGRHGRSGWGPMLPFMWGWILMEVASPVGMLVWWWLGDRSVDNIASVFLALWLMHYVNRTFIYAWTRRDRAKPIPLSVALMAVVFNLGNSYLNGRWLFDLGPTLDWTWASDPRFIVGMVVFFVGFAINLQADSILFNLRKPGEKGYKIPKGGMYRWVTCPNYLGELLEWAGFALLTWSLGGLTFFVWTFANLAPRAVANHQWYQKKFDDYPKERKALVPLVW